MPTTRDNVVLNKAAIIERSLRRMKEAPCVRIVVTFNNSIGNRNFKIV